MATNYREKRRSRRADTRTAARQGLVELNPLESRSGAPPKLVKVGRWSGGSEHAAGSSLTVMVGDRFEVRVGSGFEPATLVRLVRALEQV